MRGDLNRKGIEKEGTDMDAFTEPAITVAEDREHATSSPPASPAVSVKSTTPAQSSPPPENKIKVVYHILKFIPNNNIYIMVLNQYV